MLRKLAITFFVLILLLGGVLGYLQYIKIKKPISPAIDAVPADAFMIIQSVNAQAIWQSFNQGNALWTDLKRVGSFDALNTNLAKLDGVITADSRLEKLVQKSPVFISYHALDSNNVELLISCNIPNSIEEEELKQLIENNVDKSTVFSEYLYQNTIIHEIKYRGPNNTTLCYTKLKGTFIASYSASLLKRSVDHLNTNITLSQDPAFNKVYNAAGNNVDASIFINFKYINILTKLVFNTATINQLASANNLASWAVLDVKLAANSLQLNGFTYANDSLNNYLCVFKNSTPQPLMGTTVMPANVASYLSLTFDDYKIINQNYKNYLAKNNTLKQRNEAVEKINTKYSIDLDRIMNNAFIKEIDLFKISEQDSSNAGDIINIHCADGIAAYAQFKELFNGTASKTIGVNDEPTPADNDSLQHIQDSIQRLKPKAGFYKVKANNIFSAVLGSFYNSTNSSYVLYYNNDFVFAKDMPTLEAVYNAIKENTTLAQTDSYVKFAQSAAAKANIHWYVNGSKSIINVAPKLNLMAALELNRYSEIIEKTEGFIMQLSNAGNSMLLTNIYARYNALSKTPDNTLWKVKLDSAIISQPFIVANHTNNTKEVIVQDAAHNIYLISCTGEVLWKRNIHETIQGKITQVDKFKNKKLQYVFNTPTAIYMLDRNGKDIENFPVKLSAKATNSVSVFDYDKQRDYRLIIACDNNRVYNYDADGGAIGGWNNAAYPTTIRANIGWFNVKGKDYITIVEDNGTVTFADRKGATINSYNKAFVMGSNHQLCYSLTDKAATTCVLTTDNEGAIQKLFVDGHTETISINKLSPAHYLDVIDFNEDGEDDYMITEMNYVAVFDKNKKMLFNHKFKNTITQQPTIYKTSANHYKIGVVTALSSEIFLVNNDGSVAEGFPKNGITNFTLTDANKDDINDIIVGTSPNYVTAYSLTEAGKLYKPKEVEVEKEKTTKEPEPKIKKDVKKEGNKKVVEKTKTQKKETTTDKKKTIEKTTKDKKEKDGKTDKEKPKTKKEGVEKKKATDTKKEKDTSPKKTKDKPKEKTKPKKEEPKNNDSDDDKIINDSSEG